ncbi:MAG: hypothetical protein GC203_15055 [Phenylobacterium sp.]|uniref:hypothetical protein n=1 Tax=Phenylobacterium sp. TaxID=1871053 RepID=UPI0025FC2355|nr:hypothetical protein [Phenylobacterium sp.]MBI1199177.1 hypothetical protein [Phenylobacterium sp.]
MLILAAALAVAVAVIAALNVGPIQRSKSWEATVTPLASIIGSGFLICGPLLAREFGGAAAPAMGVLLLLAYGLGAVVRFNIRRLEPLLADLPPRDPIAWTARFTQAVLAAAYAVSVAYYLKLLAEFALRPFALGPDLQALASRGLVTALVGMFVVLALSGGLHRMERLAHMTVSLKLGVIAGMFVALALSWITAAAPPGLPPLKVSVQSLPMLLGLLITVQGFETSRYMGEAYGPEVRRRAMRHAQWISSAIYMVFLVLLTPFLGRAAQTEGVAGILDIMALTAPLMGGVVMTGALASQLSAATADSIGSAGLASELSEKRLSLKMGFVASAALTVAVVWLTDPFEVVAAASRAFGAFYMLQCVLAVMAARRTGAAGWPAQVGMAALGAAALAAALAGAPAGG